MRYLRRVPFFAAALLLLLPAFSFGFADPVTYNFTNITNNDATDALIGENQLSVVVHDEGTLLAKFCFNNSGPEASSITDVYWDDDVVWDDNTGLLTSIQSFSTTGTVAFTEGATPGNLPGGAGILPAFSADFSADSDPPAQPNGVNPGEELCVLFNYTTEGSAQNGFLDELIPALDSGQLRIGIHVQGYASGGSESFVTDGVTIIPEPASMLLAMIGMSLVGGLKKRFQ